MKVRLDQLANLHRDAQAIGITSICSAHPVVLRAALRHGRISGSTVLVEATCNQVNHLGGYTGMTPKDFAVLTRGLAEEEGLPAEDLILGGDHLGPNPWRDQAADAALEEAEAMIDSYVRAGFRKIHLDASMGCRGEPDALDDEQTADRAARLAHVAEAAARDAGGEMPVFVIGTEVPPPGGADHVLASITPTSPDAARQTLQVHRDVFTASGLEDAFARVIALVVQPGVEFGNQNVIFYDRDRARDLSRLLEGERQIVFEAHSTDYQGTERLRELVQDGFAILKVGPELTFVLREALYGLDAVASELCPDYTNHALRDTLERLMLEEPSDWNRHYQGTASEQSLLRHFSLSDRIRYYWSKPAARAAVDSLGRILAGRSVPMPLLRQYLPHAVRFADAPLDPAEVLIAQVTDTIARYHQACQPAH
jgi:D-tagatose 6-phosphate 4-epimerase